MSPWKSRPPTYIHDYRIASRNRSSPLETCNFPQLSLKLVIDIATKKNLAHYCWNASRQKAPSIRAVIMHLCFKCVVRYVHALSDSFYTFFSPPLDKAIMFKYLAIILSIWWHVLYNIRRGLYVIFNNLLN